MRCKASMNNTFKNFRNEVKVRYRTIVRLSRYRMCARDSMQYTGKA